MRFHHPDLHGRGVRTEQRRLADEERILHITSRMVGREVQRFKIVVVVFHFLSFNHTKAHRDKNRLNLVQCLRQGMFRAKESAASWKRWIDGHVAARWFPC